MAFLWNVPDRNHPDPYKDTPPDVWGEIGITSLGLTEAFGVAVLLLVAVYFVFMYRYPVAQVPTPGETMCTADARQCPDGSFVGRVGPNCEFAPCSGETEQDINTFCGGIAGFPCPGGYVCNLDGNYPDAGGKCVKSR